MRVKKRRKSVRYRGWQTAKRGKSHRTRGSGNQGGVGMSGTGKRGDQKKTLVIKLTGGNNYFGKDKALRRGNIAPKLEVINISDISLRTQDKSGVIDLTGYKILGEGEIKGKFKIKASAVSVSAKDKIEKSGSELVLLHSEDKKEESKAEKPVKAEKKK